MYGAIFGDIIGSRFEFDRGGKTKDFELFTSEDCFTDDTAMTIAVGDGLMRAGKDASISEIKKTIIKSMKYWGHKYPNAGYGGSFYEWLFYSKNPKPYGSYGNGSAMRVSSAGWLYDSLERTRDVARATAEVTHNHPEGIKGADCTATVIYLSRTGKSKEEIREFVLNEFGYDLSESLDELRARHAHIESCQDSLTKALTSFFEGNSYEDVVRNAVSLGGDTDTLAAIAGAMAEAYYGMPIMILLEGKDYLPEDMIEVLNRFDEIIHGKKDLYDDNEFIKLAIENIYEKEDEDSYVTLVSVLMKRMLEEGEAPVPMVDVNHVMDSYDMNKMVIGEDFSFEEDLRLRMDTMQDGEGKEWIPLFTDQDEIHKGNTTNITINMSIQNILENGYFDEKMSGVVINPFGQSITLNKEIVKIILEGYKELIEEQDA